MSKIDYQHLIQEDKIHGSLYTDEDIYEDEKAWAGINKVKKGFGVLLSG